MDEFATQDGAIQGHIENTDVRFSVKSGLSHDVAGQESRTMQRIELSINNKTVVIQYSGNNEMYLKGQDQGGRITTLNDKDQKAIKEAQANLGVGADQSTNIYAEIGKTLNLLDSWPKHLPLLIWHSNDQMISAVDKDKVVSAGLDKKGKTKWADATAIDKSILDKPDAILQFPDIEPYEVLEALEAKPESDGLDQSSPRVRIVGKPDSNSSISLCSNMGSSRSGSYPLLTGMDPVPYIQVGSESFPTPAYPSIVGGSSCLGRCGAGCTSGVLSVPAASNAYSQDCLEHDMCATKYGIVHPYCNIILADAAGDFFSSPACQHNLQLENIVISTSSYATNQPSVVSSKDNLFVVFTVKNAASSKLPHNGVYVDIYVDGYLKKTLQITAVLNGNDARRYYYQLGVLGPQSLYTGAHFVDIKLRAPSISQTSTADDISSRQFAVQ